MFTFTKDRNYTPQGTLERAGKNTLKNTRKKCGNQIQI